MSGDESGPLDQIDGDAVVKMSREGSDVRKVSSAGLDARVGTLPPAGNRLQSQSAKPLVPTGRKYSADGSTTGDVSASRRGSNSSIGKSAAPSGGDDVPHLPNIASGRSTPSGSAAGPPAAPSPAKPKGIPKPSSSSTQSPGQAGSDGNTGGSPAAPSSSGRNPDRRTSPGVNSRVPYAEGSPYAPDAGRSRAPATTVADTADSRAGRGDAGSGPARGVSPGRDPREAGWNSSASKGAAPQGAAAAPAPRRDLKVSGPDEDERRKRVEWVREKRRREEAKAREEAERRQAEENKRREEEQARLEARRAAIRERIQKQHEIAAKLAQERAKADEAARGAIGRFLAAKPLHQRLKEDYERQQAELEAEKKRQYDEETRSRHVRPHQIISGEVQVKPTAKPEGASSPGAPERPLPGRSPGHSRGSAGADSTGGGSGAGSVAAGPSSSRGRVAARAPRAAGDARPPVPRVAAAAAAEGSSASSSPKAAAFSVRTGSAGKASSSSPASGTSAALPAGKPRVQGPTLASTSSKGSRRVANRLGSLATKGHLIDRASSPFVFNEAGVPVNVPPPTHLAANGGQVFEVDAAARPPLPPPPPPPPPAELSRELSESDGAVLEAATLMAVGAGAAVAVAEVSSARGSATAVTAERSDSVSAVAAADGRGGGGQSAALYDSYDDTPQMQSPLTRASKGAADGYLSEPAVEPEPGQDTWGSDAADSDSEDEAATSAVATAHATAPGGKQQPSGANSASKAADKAAVEDGDEGEQDGDEDEEEQDDDDWEEDEEQDASTPGAAKTPTDTAVPSPPAPVVGAGEAPNDSEERPSQQQEYGEQEAESLQPAAAEGPKITDDAEAQPEAGAAAEVTGAEPAAETEGQEHVAEARPVAGRDEDDAQQPDEDDYKDDNDLSTMETNDPAEKVEAADAGPSAADGEEAARPPPAAEEDVDRSAEATAAAVQDDESVEVAAATAMADDDKDVEAAAAVLAADDDKELEVAATADDDKDVEAAATPADDDKDVEAAVEAEDADKGAEVAVADDHDAAKVEERGDDDLEADADKGTDLNKPAAPDAGREAQAAGAEVGEPDGRGGDGLKQAKTSAEENDIVGATPKLGEMA